MSLYFDVKGKQGIEFFPEGRIIMNYGLVFWREVTVDVGYLFLTNMQLFTTKTSTDGLESVEYLWVTMMFLSAVWTLILMAPIHCGEYVGEQVM